MGSLQTYTAYNEKGNKLVGYLTTPDKEVVAICRDVLRWFSPVSTVELRASHFRRVQLHRNNRMYALLLHVCEFVHEHWLPDAAGGPSRFGDFVRHGLPALFEKFVFNFFAHELPAGWTTSAPHLEWPMSGPMPTPARSSRA